MHRCADHVGEASLGFDGNAAFIVFDEPELEIAPA
jgi:hypothetical protein